MKFESIPFHTLSKTRRMFAHTPDGWVDITSSEETKHIKISVRTGHGVLMLDIEPDDASAIGAELIAAAEAINAAKEAA